MGTKLGEKEIFETLKSILKKAQEDEHSEKIDVESIGEKDDLRLLGMDSLDVITFRFALDEAFDIEIPDEDFEDKELTNIKNLIGYLKDRI